MSTGNIDYDGSIEISGSVTANMEVKAGGNVVINGGVESARVIAGGNIVIAKGMNGMGKGYLRAGGNIMVKFLENVRVVTGGYLESEAIMHCVVTAGTDVRVDGRRGIILGGLVQAANSITVKDCGRQHEHGYHAGGRSGSSDQISVRPCAEDCGRGQENRGCGPGGIR